MRSTFVRGLLLWFACTAFVLAVPAFSRGGDFEPIPPEEFKVNEVPGQPGAPAIILYYQRIDDDTTRRTFFYTRMKILTEEGRQYAKVFIEHKTDEPIGDVKAHTVHPDGTTVDFDGKILDETDTPPRRFGREFVFAFPGSKLATFTLPSVQIGDILEFRYSQRRSTDRSSNARALPYDWKLEKELFQRRIHYVFVFGTGPANSRERPAANDRIAGVKVLRFLPKGAELKQLGYKIELTAADIPPKNIEPYASTRGKPEYQVRFLYDTIQKPEKDYVEHKAKRWDAEISTFLADRDALREQALRIVAAGDTPEQKVRKIYDYVSTFTNLSHEHRSVAELSNVGYSASVVIGAKAGRQRDLNRVFVGLVRAVDIPASVMLMEMPESPFRPEESEWWSLTYTELAIVRLGDKDVYLDPGTPFAPYGELQAKFAGVKGVRQSASGKDTEITMTPDPGFKDSVTKRVTFLHLKDDQILSGKITITYSGLEALDRRLRSLHLDGGGRKKGLEEELRKTLPSGAYVTLLNEPAWESTEPLIAEFDVTMRIGASNENSWTLPMHVFDFSRPAIFTAPTRVDPIGFERPYGIQDEIHVTLPEGITARTVPAKEELNPDFAYYRASYGQQGHELVATRLMVLKRHVLGPERYAELKGFFDKVKATDDRQIVLDKASAVTGQ